MSLEIEQVPCLVLAGGRSQRMGGRDKALLELAGRPLLAHVIDRLSPQSSRIAISSNGGAGPFAPFGLPVLADTTPGFAGPLAGILEGLRWAAVSQPGARYMVSAPTDTPFLPEDLVSRFLAAATGKAGAIVIAASPRGTHPVVALWPLEIRSKLESVLARGRGKVHDFVRENGALEVAFVDLERADKTIDPFFNVNTPEELDEARAFLRSNVEVPVVGIAGWKNSGKTSLVESLVRELTGRGLRVATVKHSHHDLRPDDTATDSARHARAGATQTAVVSANAWMLGDAIFTEPEPALEAIIGQLSPVDLILVEGYKSAFIPKIEVRRRDQADKRPLADSDPLVIAIATDHATEGADVPVFRLDDAGALAEFICRRIAASKTGS